MRKYLAIILFLLILAVLFAGCNNAGSSVPEALVTEGATEELADKPETSSVEPIELSGQLTTHFIDVGQGDSILIQTPEQNILIDAGDREYGNTVVSYIKSQGVSELDLVVGTHAHSDHIGGLIQVLKDIPVKEVIDPAVVHTTKTFEEYLTLIDQKDITFTEGRAGMNCDIGGATMEILHPTSPSSSSLNDSSIVAKITFGQVSFLLTGDIEQKSESEIIARKEPVESTILKVPHHGSSTSSSKSFIKTVSPETVVIMCGQDNSYGHPHEETLKTYMGIDIYRTDIHGTIVITTDGQTYDINVKPYMHTPQKKPEPAENDSTGFIGSIKSDKYHKPDCKHAKSIKQENKIIFNSVEEAKEKGYVPCKVCNPPN